jgi:hypothetical protein
MRRGGFPLFSVAALCAAAVALCLVLSLARTVRAQVVEVDARGSLFTEPSKTSKMTVITPSLSVAATPLDFVTVNAGYSADIVSGASESVKAGPTFASTPDIVSTASVTDLRQTAVGGLTFHKGHTDFGGSYSYGTENDYRSNAITATASSDFLQRNTKVEAAYSHGFDKVCDLTNNANQAPTVRQAMDSSAGCFATGQGRRSLDVSIDNFQGAWTQSWTPKLATQFVVTGSIMNGFLSNPYRAVAIGPSGANAQEHHPDNRARFGAALRLKYFLKPIDASVGAGFRYYRDTWDISSQTYELDLEKNFLPWLRLRLNGRYYRQTAAVFWSDDYVGGEPLNGTRGQYFSGDRELSPLSSLLGGARVTASFHGRPGERIVHLFMDLDLSMGVTMIRTFLDNFTWAGNKPDDTLALVIGGNVTAMF